MVSARSCPDGPFSMCHVCQAASKTETQSRLMKKDHILGFLLPAKARQCGKLLCTHVIIVLLGRSPCLFSSSGSHGPVGAAMSLLTSSLALSSKASGEAMRPVAIAGRERVPLVGPVFMVLWSILGMFR